MIKDNINATRDIILNILFIVSLPYLPSGYFLLSLSLIYKKIRKILSKKKRSVIIEYQVILKLSAMIPQHNKTAVKKRNIKVNISKRSMFFCFINSLLKNKKLKNSAFLSFTNFTINGNKPITFEISNKA